MIDHQCKIAKKCSSCQLSNLSLQEQLRYKQNICKKHIGSICEIKPIVSCDTDSCDTNSCGSYRYRNKAQFVYVKEGNGKKATYKKAIYQSKFGSSIATPDCLLCSVRANETADILSSLLFSFKVPLYDKKTDRGWLKSVVIREGARSLEMMVILNGKSLDFPAKSTFVSALIKKCPYITTLVVTENKSDDKLFIGKSYKVLYGEGKIHDTLCEKIFEISPNSFYQINSAQCERLYATAIKLAELDKTQTVLDAYCGIGTIGIIASNYAKKVISVEENKNAVDNANINKTLNNIDNIEFYSMDASRFMQKLIDENIKIDVAFLDPPRLGCSVSFLKSLSKVGVKKIVYISCCVETQARDIKVLHRLGYNASVCVPFDMFSQTKHVESVVLISKTK